MMPRWRQRYHLFAACFMCLLFTGISIIAAISVFGGARVQDGGTARIIATVVFGILAILGAVAQFWTRRRIVKEFSYDGHELRFRTLAGSEEQIWLLPEIASVREPRGRAPGMGYLVTRRDKRYVILDYTLKNSALAATRIQFDVESRV